MCQGLGLDNSGGHIAIETGSHGRGITCSRSPYNDQATQAAIGGQQKVLSVGGILVNHVGKGNRISKGHQPYLGSRWGHGIEVAEELDDRRVIGHGDPQVGFEILERLDDIGNSQGKLPGNDHTGAKHTKNAISAGGNQAERSVCKNNLNSW